MITTEQIIIEEWSDNEFIAHWHDVEAVGFGTGRAEATADLIQNIIELYEDLRDTKEDELGKLPRKWKQIMAPMFA